MQKKDWSELISTEASKQVQEQLVLVDKCKVVQVLSKIESQDYIHTYVTIPAGGEPLQPGVGHLKSEGGGLQPGGGGCSQEVGGLQAGAVMLFELARYGLEFELQEGQLVSRDYQGYRLRLQQQLVEVVGSHSHGSASVTAVAAAGRADGDGSEVHDCVQSISSLASGALMSTGNSGSRSSNGNLSSMSTSSTSSLDGLDLELPAGEHVAKPLQLRYTLPEFHQYLLLQRMEGSGVVLGAAKADALVLVPATETGVQHSNAGQVVMVLPEGSGAKLKVKGWYLPGYVSTHNHYYNQLGQCLQGVTMLYMDTMDCLRCIKLGCMVARLWLSLL
jgi:hypothetical protein